MLPTRHEGLLDMVIADNSALRTSAAYVPAGRTVPLGANVDDGLNAMPEPLQGVIDSELTPLEAAEMRQSNAER
jgi:hypothetical protein